MQRARESRQCAIIVHGGAYAIPDEIGDAAKTGCEEAAKVGYQVLLAGKSAVDAVEQAVRILEDNPLMNAGHGSVLNMAGEVELDAIIADGSTLSFGSVAGVKDIANPISLARMVMDNSDHVMLIGQGANIFAREMGVAEVPSDQLVTVRGRKEFEHFKKYSTVVKDVFKGREDLQGHDTVGAVAVDLHGNIAAGTSTGGISLKHVGRVGDSPLIGSGAYADSTVGGVSCTGHGEAIAKVLLAQHALSVLRAKQEGPESALAESLKYMLDRVGGKGGAIMVTKDREVGRCYTTRKMAWASVNKLGKLNSGL